MRGAFFVAGKRRRINQAPVPVLASTAHLAAGAPAATIPGNAPIPLRDDPRTFVEKRSAAQLTERAASHEHFIDLCQLLGQPTPGTDSAGEDYRFEKHVKVVGAASKGSKGEAGFVDVWKRGHFAWEYKHKDKYKTLDEAYRQLSTATTSTTRRCRSQTRVHELDLYNI